MSLPIFFIWNASNDPEDMREHGTFNLVNHTRAYPLDTCVIGVLYADSHQTRHVADKLHANLMTMPSPNAALSDKHIAHIAKHFPNAKKGDGFHTILAPLYAKTGVEYLNPDNY